MCASILYDFCFFVLHRKSSSHLDSFLKIQFLNYIALHVYKQTYTPTTNAYFLILVFQVPDTLLQID